MLPTIATGNVGSALAGEYEVANSLRFENANSDYLSRTQSTPTDNNKYTFSCWVKRGNLGSIQALLGSFTNSTNRGQLEFNSSNQLNYYENLSGSTSAQVTTTQVFRDVSAWLNIVLNVDLDQSTASDRIKMYVNGTQITSFGTATYPSQGATSVIANCTASNGLLVGGSTSDYSTFYNIDGYMAEVVYLDGQTLNPTSFGEFDEDTNIWKPIDVSGLTFGNNGFYLPFENSGALGQDDSGNGNNFTVNNLTSIDQTTDTCTNNFATWNPLDNYYASSTFSNGNLQLASGGSGIETWNTSTIAVSSGKWYVELKHTGGSSTPYRQLFGIAQTTTTSASAQLGSTSTSWGYYDNTGNVRNNNSDISWTGDTWTQNDIIGLALDLDNNRLFFSKNGTWQNSADPTTSTGAITITAGTYFIAWGDATTHSNYSQCNFGNPVHSITSGNSDGNGYGNFEYSVPSGYYALNTKNLAEYG